MLQILWRTTQVRQFPLFVALIITAFAVNSPAWAQDDTSFIEFPTTEDGTAYRDAVDGTGVSTDLGYVDDTTQDFLNGDVRPTEPVREPGDIYLPRGGSGPGVFIVVALFVIALFLILKFGAGGTLLRGDPKNVEKKKTASESWGLKPEDIPEGDLLSRVKSMSDRREALILLLRYCLLRAAEATDTNFRRADTEREALGRLPQQWTYFAQLRRLLMQTELVHYGGRQIDDESYQSALNDGAAILSAGGARGR